MSKIANIGNEVEILYVGKLENQDVFDSTEGKDPFKFVLGSTSIIKGINEAVLGMEVGQKKTIELSPELAYGNYDEGLVAKVPRSKVPDNAQIGDILTDPKGGNWWVRQIDDNFIIVDGNHPLAGKILLFDIELIRILH